MLTWRTLAVPFLAAAWMGCGNLEVDLPDAETSVEAAVVMRDAAQRVAECDQAPDGQECGEDDATLRHCLYNACVLNVCGDGIKAGEEVCDDGNQVDADGCNSQCKEAACGNGVIDAREQCDDGNKTNDDGCDSMCRKDGGGSGAQGEMRDAATGPDAASGGAGGAMAEAGTPSADSGVAVMDSSSPQADAGMLAETGSGEVDSAAVVDSSVDATFHDAAACQACVRGTTSPCLDYLGTGDFVTGCFSNADPQIVERCVAAFRCGLTDPNQCAGDAARLVRCFCGTLIIEDGSCFGPSAVPNGRCVQEVYAATGCTTPGCVNTNMVLPESASYYAQYLTLCTMDPEFGCAASCPLPLESF